MTYDVTIFGIDMTLKPVAFTLFGSWNVYWYGIIIALGFLLAVAYAVFNAKRFNIDFDRLLDVVLVATPVAVLSARLYYIIFSDSMTIKDFFSFSSGGFAGLAIYGGVIGAFASGALMCAIRKLKILDVFDIASIGFLIGQGIGRWGNFINQEAFGSATGSDWFGMSSQAVDSVLGEGVLAHPCFLYESVWCLLGVLLLHLLSKRRSFSGEIALSYCVWYGFGRGFIELLRTDSLYIGSVRVSALLSFVACVGALITLAVVKHRMKIPVVEYVPMFAENAEPDETEEISVETEVTAEEE